MSKNIRMTAAQTAVLMAILTLVSKLLGFIREVVLAGFFGTSYVVDAYVMSFAILSVIFGGLIASISTAYMPLFSQTLEGQGPKSGNIFTSQIINLLIIITLVISVIGIVLSDQIVQILAFGFKGETAKLTSYFIKVLFSYIIFSSTASILEAYLQYKGIFLPQIISGYFISIAIICGIIFSYYTNWYYLAYGTLLGYALRCFAMLCIAKRRGYVYYKDLNLKDNVSELARLAFPVFIGSYITYINLFIDKTLASGLTEGSISALNYSSLLNGMIIGVTVTILSTIIYPKLSYANSSNLYNRFNDLVTKGLNIVIIVALPCSLGAILYSSEIVQIVYERGAFKGAATIMTGSAFKCYAVGMLFIALNDFIVKIYYSMCDMKTPMIFGAVGVILNIILNLILVQYMGYRGLALSTSIASFCNTALLMIGIKVYHPRVRLIESKEKIIKVIICAIIAIGCSYAAYQFINLQHSILMRMVRLSIGISVAILVYILALYICKIDEIKLIKKILKIK